MKIHISRKHGGVGESFGTVHNTSRDSVNRATTSKSRTYYHNKFQQIGQSKEKQNDILDFLDEILEPMRKLNEFKYLSTELNNSTSTGYTNTMQQIAAMIRSSAASNDFGLNRRFEPPGCGATLGYEGFICTKCLYFTFEQVLDTPARKSVRFNHICKQQAVESMLGEDINRMLITHLKVLNYCITNIVASTSQYHEKANIKAAETPSFEIKNGSEIYEVCIDLTEVPMSKIPPWIYEVVQTGSTITDKTGIQEFVQLFGSTFGFFRLMINGISRFYFVYISNGLEPQNVRYLKKLFEPSTHADKNSSSYIEEDLKLQTYWT